MSGISTHVLDLSSGTPARGIPVRLLRDGRELSTALTDADGRCTALLPADSCLDGGTYHLVFEVQSRFPEGFYPEVTVAFVVRDPASHYHVPLLISAFGYTTYRGS